MSEWLGMPARLNTGPVRALVDAWQRLILLDTMTDRMAWIPQIVAFAKAFAAYYNGLELRQKSPDTEMEIDQALEGSWDAAQRLWIWFIDGAVESAEDQITDDNVSKTLNLARSMKGDERSNVCRLLYKYFEDQLSTDRASILYPKQNARQADSVAIVSDASATVVTIEQIDEDVLDTSQNILGDQPSEHEKNESQEKWYQLASNVKCSAERVWRDMFLNPQRPPQRMTLRKVARISHLLMLLWLEIVLYQDRSLYNYDPRIIEGGRSMEIESTRGGIREHIKEYQSIIQRWDKELGKAIKAIDAQSGRRRKKTAFRSHHLESQQFRRLIRQFSDPSPEELGWDSQVAEAEAELRYQLRDEVRREKLTDGRWIAALGLWILKVTTGYGTRPIYFLYTTLWALGIDAALFFLIDLFHSRLDPHGPACVLSQPQSQQWSDVVPFVLNSLMHYLYLAATTLTSLGADTSLATYCHSWSSQALLVVSAALGYFMLGLLGALLYTQLTQRD